jgi:hypothetical protein
METRPLAIIVMAVAVACIGLNSMVYNNGPWFSSCPTRNGKEVSLALVGTWHSYVHRRTARQVGPIGAGSSFAFDAHQDTGGAPTESNQREKAEWHFSLVS